jgi:phenylacetate-CoA ligase
VAGAVYYGFDKIGCTVIPVGTGNTERMVTAIQRLGATGISCTPSYGLYLIDWCLEHGIDTRSLGLTNMITAGEPGGGDPLIRSKIEEAFGCQVRESMGIGDISLSAWAEDSDGNGMHFMARDAVHVELIDPADGQPIPWEDGAEGELVYTALKREAMPLLRFRSRDHVVVNMKPNPTGRTGPRIRCIGRTDDMLIVRGVNLFPSAIREILNGFTPEVSGLFLIRPREQGVLQSPPLPVSVELGPGVTAPPGLAERIKMEIRERLLITAEISLVPHGTVPRETYKSKLVDYSDASGAVVNG